MTGRRDVREEVLAAWENILDRTTDMGGRAHAVALELAAAAENRGADLNPPRPSRDPAVEWRPEYQRPGDQKAGQRLARTALYGTGTCQLCHTEQNLTRDGRVDEHPIEPDEPDCLGAALPPTTDRSEP
jgi:hypothetical protein